ncbi:MAG: L-serine ammonia-lyase, iron-sulfur-dependent, subunit alpha [Peptostreptococcaceae bacterium]|nr:L-serine ammonia-lyase, iron-sulfur-dependent, subunit alpha [Peptostreptococcaceae bacterium]
MEQTRKYDFADGVSLLKMTKEYNLSIAELMLEREMEVFGKKKEDIMAALLHSYEIMKRSTKKPLEQKLKTMGGLIGGEAKMMMENKSPITGEFFRRVIAYSMAVLEQNSSMGLIVAAPTAGSSGVIPGSFVALQEEHGFSDEKMLDALLTAGAIGYIITRNATVSGAEGGCQAEIGSAAAMAAGAIVELFGGTPKQALDAASTAIANMLGLVCDPIAGLVESPCQKRNAMGATNAIISADITLSGSGNPIPFDETVSAMYSVGRALPFELRESALGGLAGTPAGCSLSCKIFG